MLCGCNWSLRKTVACPRPHRLLGFAALNPTYDGECHREMENIGR